MITYELAIFIGIIISIIYILIALFFKIKPKKIIVSCIFIAYLTAVAVVTLFPIFVDEKVEYYGDMTWYNIIPFKTITETLQYGITTTAVTQILGNVLLSVPFGIFIMLFLQEPKWCNMFLLSLSFPVVIELSQMFIGFSINNMYRNVDIDDIILNIIGTYVGYAVYKILPSKLKKI